MYNSASATSMVAADESPDRDWLAVASSNVGLIFCIATLSLYTFGVFVRPLTAEFGWTRTEMFASSAILYYTQALSSPMWGALTDRFGPRIALLFSVTAISVLFASLGLLTAHLWHFYLVAALIPLLAGGASPIGYSAVIVRRFDRKLGLALGFALSGVGLGAAILPVLAQLLVDHVGWRGAYVGLGALTFLITMPAALIATRKVPAPVRRTATLGLPALASMARTPAFVVMCTSLFLLAAVSVGTAAHLVPMMTDRGLTPSAAARLASIMGIAVVAGRCGLGWILDRVHASYVLAAVSLTAASAFLLLAYGEGLAPAHLAAALVGSVVGAEVDFGSFLICRYFGAAAFGRLYGVIFGMFVLGVGSGPLALGAMFDRFGGYAPGLLVFTAAGMIVAVLATLLPDYGVIREELPAALPELNS
jgi:MFS family permease